ncbi:MAG: TIGR03792 family protein [Synechococcus sp.]|nr:TIGR03792 family protein [Synechococcus sp.]
MDSHRPPPPRATAELPPASGAVAAAAATHAADAADATQAADAVDTVNVLEAAAATRAVEAVQAVALSTGADRAERQSGGRNGDRDGAMQAERMEGEVIEHLRLKVPAAARQAWLEAEQASWEPWLRAQAGFLGRELRWDEQRQEGQLLIRWASRALWQAIPAAAVEQVQQQFERSAHAALARLGVVSVAVAGDAAPGIGAALLPAANPFPLVYAGELEPDAQP